MQVHCFVSHLECSATGERHEFGRPYNLSRAGKPLLVRYDLDALRISVNRDALRDLPTGLWRYLPLLPINDANQIISLGEVETPLIPLSTLAARVGARCLMIKDEGRLPTGSFKARGLAVAVTMAHGFGAGRLAIPTNGNAGAALAAYAARAGMECFVFCPQDTPEVNIREIAAEGAHVWRVNGLINDCGRIVSEGQQRMGWFDMSTLKEPYRIEGKKTMGIELADQLGWELPDVIFYPTGGGTGLIGMWKAFQELGQLGWIGQKRPRMIAVQAEGCAPIVKAFEQGADRAELWEAAQTIAAGIRVPAGIGDFLILRAVRESQGFAMTVSDDAILAAREEVAKAEGLLCSPEGAATYAAWRKALAEKRISVDDHVVLFNCATGLKYPLAEAGDPWKGFESDRSQRSPK